MKTRIQALDGLRGLAVTAVVVNHVSPGTLRGGWLGVDIFFVLSGYLITSLLLNEYAVAGHIDLRGFYARRVRRLLPALIVLLLAIAVVTRLVKLVDGLPRGRANAGTRVIAVSLPRLNCLDGHQAKLEGAAQ